MMAELIAAHLGPETIESMRVQCLIVADCSCGRSYTFAQFSQLPYVGCQTAPDWPCVLELRDCCECHSTKGVWVDADGFPTDENGRRL